MATEKEKVGQVRVRITDMNEELLKDSTNAILESFKKYTNEREIAYHIKREYFIFFQINYVSMDKKYLPSWHCIIGRNFGSYVTHDEG